VVGGLRRACHARPGLESSLAAHCLGLTPPPPPSPRGEGPGAAVRTEGGTRSGGTGRVRATLEPVRAWASL
jgi:hypothetical protein